VHPRPPRRTTHAIGTPKNRLVYDRWGRYGRPIVLLHGLLYDRTMWWPVAAELGNNCAAVAVDLPGHGQSAPRDEYALDALAYDLATLVHSLHLYRAPILVGHAKSALLAQAFADRCAVQAVITVDEPAGEPPATAEQLAAEADLNDVPQIYHQFAVARRDTLLLTGYRTWFSTPAATQGHADARRWTGVNGRSFPHLQDPVGFAARLGSIA
jgi:pimeloyl-ACP methyl ester carboxylesterase